MIKTTALYQLPGYKTLKLVVESEPIFSSDYYDPTSIPGSNNSVMAEERNPLPSLGTVTVPCSGIKYECRCGC
jgi:hypothetical protein